MAKRNKQSLTALADAAFKKAAQEVIKRAAESGTPVIVWKNGAIAALKPGEVQMGRVKRAGRREGKHL